MQQTVSKDVPEVLVREMTLHDYDGVVSVWSSAGLPYKMLGRDSRDSIAEGLKGACSIFLVAVLADRIVGTALCTHDGRKGWINRLAVVPEMQGMGVGRMLVEEAERRFSGLGIKVYCCLIMKDNAVSQRFFAELGYDEHDDVLYFSKRTMKDV